MKTLFLHRQISKIRASGRAWRTAVRPGTLWASICPVGIGLMFVWCRGVKEWNGEFIFLGACLLMTGVLVQCLTNVINDYYDFQRGADGPGREGPLRALSGGLMQVKEMRFGIWMMVILIVWLSSMIATVVVGSGSIGESIAVWGLMICCLLLAYGYTGGRYSLAYMGIADGFAFVFFGPLITGVVVWLMGGGVNVWGIVSGVPSGCFAVAMLSVNNLRDMETDQKVHKKTLAVRFGKRFVQMEYVVSLGIAGLLMAVVGIAKGKIAYGLLLLIWIVLGRAIWSVFICRGRQLNRVLSRTARGHLVYSFLFGVVLYLERGQS